VKTLFLNPPSFKGFDGGAGSRYQARREITSFWYPTWLAHAAALVPGSRLLDCPPHQITLEQCLQIAKDYDLVVIFTSAPTFTNDCKVAQAIKQLNPAVQIGMVGPHVTVLAEDALKAEPAIDWVARGEFDLTCKEVAEGAPLPQVRGLSYRTPNGQIVHNPPRALIEDLDSLPWVVDVYKRDLDIKRYYIGYLEHPYISIYTGRGCPAQCIFCLWPQTMTGHKYRTRSPENVTAEIAHAKKLFPEVKEFFFDDDTFTINQKRACEIARLLAPLGVTWSCSSRVTVSYETLKVLRECGLRCVMVGFESGNQEILNRAKKGITLQQAREFVKNCHSLGIKVHGTFMLGLPGETPETIQQTIQFAKELDVFTIQVSLATPYPGTEFYRLAMENGWLVKSNSDALVEPVGFQDAVLEYPTISRNELFDAVERFYKEYYFRPRPILRIFKTMLQDSRVFLRRLREGCEFLSSMWLRRKAHQNTEH
jgi:hopanoid biosynthesis associated radical SAM protein HpnJ